MPVISYVCSILWLNLADVSTSKSPRGTVIGRGKTVTTASGSRTKPGSVSKPQATVAAGVKKRAELGSAMRPRGPVSQSSKLFFCFFTLQYYGQVYIVEGVIIVVLVFCTNYSL